MTPAGPLRDLISSGHAVDLILAVIAGEFVYLAWRNRRQGHARDLLGIVYALAPGACLLLALRAAQTGAGWAWTAAFLTLSFPIHIADLARRRLL
jgi:hypothetical protein